MKERDRGSRGSQGIGSWQACNEFETSTTKDPPCRRPMPVKLLIAQTSSIGASVRRGGASSGVVLVTCLWFKITRSVAKSPRIAKQCDFNFKSLTHKLVFADTNIRRLRILRVRSIALSCNRIIWAHLLG
ncbi:hypothetical protein TNCV_2259911 [Trichonephila clavipes]|nr:hypothetical protein TNCV_2259911 [Trichonephila clavipes]